MKERLGTICARGGSKGVKNKNIRLISNRPLIAYTLAHAKECGLFSAVAVTSDSDEILETARNWGADFLIKRPPEMATDEAPKLPAIRHCVLEVEKQTKVHYSVIVDMDPTSPLRDLTDIQAAVDLLETQKVSNVITGVAARRSPYFNLVEVNDRGVASLSKPLAKPITRRQDSPRCFDMNASIYVWQRAALFDYPTVFNADTRLFVMPEERSTDIDNELDFEIVELLVQKRNSA